LTKRNSYETTPLEGMNHRLKSDVNRLILMELVAARLPRKWGMAYLCEICRLGKWASTIVCISSMYQGPGQSYVSST
jgi:hypothetical protein